MFEEATQEAEVIELQQFVRETLGAILAAVRSAQDTAKGSGASVAPAVAGVHEYGKTGPTATLVRGGRMYLTYVDFDVALTLETGDKKQGGIGVFLGTAGVGGRAEANVASSTASRLRFSVPIGLPAEQFQET